MILSQGKVPPIKMAQRNLPRQRVTRRNWARRMGKLLFLKLVAVKLDDARLDNFRLIPERIEKFRVRSHWPRWSRLILHAALIVQFFAVPMHQAYGKDKGKISYGEALIVNVPFPEAQVEQVVQDVTQNGLIRGTKEYNKDQYISGAHPADSTHAFPDWTGPGKVFYKVRLQAIDPRNFKDSGDMGTVAVRYVLQPQGDKNTVLRIDAVFVEDFRKIVHLSDGSVEGSEYKDIRDRLDAIDLMQRQNVEAENERQEMLQKKQLLAANGGGAPAAVAGPSYSSSSSSSSSAASVPAASAPVAPAPAAADPGATTVAAQPTTLEQGPGQTLEEHVKDLRRQVERLVKAPGAPLKSAPFHTASTLNPLQPGTEVLILISTPYWYGVETREGQHGWISRDEVEPMP
jgi:hypothetical protein